MRQLNNYFLAKVSLLFSFACLGWTLWGVPWPSEPFRVLEVSRAIEPLPTDKPRKVIELASLHLFGEKIVEKPIVVLNTQQSYLKVLGIFNSKEPGKSTAILQQGQKTTVFQEGQAIGDGRVLHKIESRRILLQREGVLEALVLQEAPPLFG